MQVQNNQNISFGAKWNTLKINEKQANHIKNSLMGNLQNVRQACTKIGATTDKVNLSLTQDPLGILIPKATLVDKNDKFIKSTKIDLQHEQQYLLDKEGLFKATLIARDTPICTQKISDLKEKNLGPAIENIIVSTINKLKD